ncbi:hypothetical protein ACH4GK_31780 [Streptomyces rimosus]|uniref:hypothetical protein n=1 Tax=Streptomyces rimosus TaxID=1927 RepID=UPI0004CA9186|nr:hypothetical protein [Streptomyces rimosus]
MTPADYRVELCSGQLTTVRNVSMVDQGRNWLTFMDATGRILFGAPTDGVLCYEARIDQPEE